MCMLSALELVRCSGHGDVPQRFVRLLLGTFLHTFEARASLWKANVMRVSIKDIAKAAGVSHSTVSRALSGSPLVSDETKVRIQRLAKEMGYSPNSLARSLVTRQTHTVGVVVTTISDPFVAQVVQGIEATAHDHGYTVLLANSGAVPEREIAAVEMLRSKRVDCVIVTSSRIGALYLEHLERIGVPIVLINNHNELSGRYTFTVTVDNYHGGYSATEHLTQLGHRRVAYVTAPADHSSDFDRMAGYRQALIDAGLEPDPAWVIPGNGRAEGGEQALETFVALEPRPTAVFCYNDMTAIGLMYAARQSGLAVPQDIAVVGFDDIPFATYFYPPLTTIAQPKAEMGSLAMEMALSLMAADRGEANGKSGESSNVVVRGKLIVRASTIGA
jgi:DNA-binding LacI/PurR family transcriptional regulator